DYVVFDYLAVITMSLFGSARVKDPDAGFAPDFISDVIRPFGRVIADRGLCIIASAGGVNPLACRDAVIRELQSQGIDLPVAAVVGDEVTGLFDELRREDVRDLDSDADF